VVMVISGVVSVVCLCARALKEKRLELPTQTLVVIYPVHGSRGQKVKGQGHAGIKCAADVGLRADMNAYMMMMMMMMVRTLLNCARRKTQNPSCIGY